MLDSSPVFFFTMQKVKLVKYFDIHSGFLNISPFEYTYGNIFLYGLGNFDQLPTEGRNLGLDWRVVIGECDDVMSIIPE